MKVSVVVSVFNSEKKLDTCLASVGSIASEIIVVDNSSTDRTTEVAKKYTDKIYKRENYPMYNTNKNFGFDKATQPWILNLDADESLTLELAEEISSLKDVPDLNGYFIPRKNVIFGKWIEHTGWYPDYQLRLFRKDTARFAEQHIHEMIALEGKSAQLKGAIYHLNYDNITHFLEKMIKTYTVSEADSLLKNGYKYKSIDIIRMPLAEFVKRYFAESGYKDGMYGLVLSILQAFYHFVVFLRLWEANKYPDEDDTKKILSEGKKLAFHEFNYWIHHLKIINEKNHLKKQLYKIRRRVLS